MPARMATARCLPCAAPKSAWPGLPLLQAQKWCTPSSLDGVRLNLRREADGR